MTCHQNREGAVRNDDNPRPDLQRRRGLVARFLMGGMRLYQKYISPLSGPRCRFYPSCSSYAVTAIEKHGAVRGTGFAVWRLLRCNPWNDGGVDDVPEPRPRTSR